MKDDNTLDAVEPLGGTASDAGRLRYIAAVLEANAHKFAVPDHIGAKANFLRELATRLTHQPDRAAVEALEAENERLQATWPKWATELLAILDDYCGGNVSNQDEIDLPEELREWLVGYRDELERQALAIRPDPSVELMEAAKLPDAIEGHWSTVEGASIANEYARKRRDQLCRGEMSDLELANRIYMAGRSDMDLLTWQTAAKERIRWLSAQLALRTTITNARGEGL